MKNKPMTLEEISEELQKVKIMQKEQNVQQDIIPEIGLWTTINIAIGDKKVEQEVFIKGKIYGINSAIGNSNTVMISGEVSS